MSQIVNPKCANSILFLCGSFSCDSFGLSHNFFFWICYTVKPVFNGFARDQSIFPFKYSVLLNEDAKETYLWIKGPKITSVKSKKVPLKTDFTVYLFFFCLNSSFSIQNRFKCNGKYISLLNLEYLN